MKFEDARAVPTFSGDLAPIASTSLDRWALTRIQRTVASAPVSFALWDGFEVRSQAGAQAGTILFKNRHALYSWVWDPDLNFGEAYMFGAVELHGDLVTMLCEIYRALGSARPRHWWLWQRSNDELVARENVHRHYDLGNEFYRLWLDREMAYT
jgi:cyclopropane-fatty-acyl-phospholipid synthase